jgi:hypothetical protein
MYLYIGGIGIRIVCIPPNIISNKIYKHICSGIGIIGIITIYRENRVYLNTAKHSRKFCLRFVMSTKFGKNIWEFVMFVRNMYV